MSRSLWVVAPLAVCFAACSGKAVSTPQALRVTVSFDAAAQSQCVRVVATPQQGEAASTGLLARKDLLTVAIYRAPSWSESVTLVARGYASCDESTDVSAFIESSDEALGEFRADGSQTVELLLKAKPVVITDLDGDGRIGADDCDDSDPDRFVGHAEACNSAKDNNCSQTQGCADPLCTGACSPQGLGSCQGGVCVGQNELSCTDGLDNDGDGQTDCLDPDCTNVSCSDGTACTSGDICRGDGGCAGTPVAVTCNTAPGVCFSAQGSCNPVDAGCVYRERDAGVACNDGNACTSNTVCVAGGTCAGPNVVTTSCTSPPSSGCFNSAGTCNPANGSCSYTVNTANTCTDGSACTTADACQADGGCRGTPMVCNTPTNPCKSTTGVCNSGVCSYPTNVQNGSNCTDADLCTPTSSCQNGTCIGSGSVTCVAQDICHDAGTCAPATGCSNPTVSCTPTECQTGGTCTPANGCMFNNRPNGTSCANGMGSCTSGTCNLNFQPFDQYTPANFNAAGAPRLATVVINCAATLNTGGSGAASFTGCNGQTAAQGDAGVEIINQTSSSVSTALLRVASLVITDGGSLTITGDRPAIIAVYGDALIAGTIIANANGTIKGPGSDINCATRTNMDGAFLTGQGGQGAGGAGFANQGGSGGEGDNGNTGAGAAQGVSGNATLTPLRGGCSGGVGGPFVAATSGGPGGAGGGALQISASRKLTLVGSIHANGGGGLGGTNLAAGGDGAGGGGSGGAIRLEGDLLTIRATSTLTVNGGTGGAGGDSAGTTGVRGAAGLDGQLGYGTTIGPAGGAKSGKGGDGAGGSVISGGAGVGAAGGSGNKSGGGGGGGATGYLYLRFNTACRESGYVFSPSSAATTGNPNSAFTASTALPTAGTCP